MTTPKILTLIGTLVILGSCAPTRSPYFRTAFLPPSPPPEPPTRTQTIVTDPPRLSPDLFAKESPKFLDLAFPPRPSQLDLRLREADERFKAGRMLYRAGDLEAARREFDRAVDLILDRREGTDAAARTRTQAELDRLISLIHRYDLEVLGAGDTEQEPFYDKAPLDEILSMTFPIDPRLKNKVREELAATVSQLPLETNDSVVSYINYFSGTRGRRTLIAGLTRAGRYKPLISRILAEEGVPQELIYLAQAESGFLPRAVSRKKAVGMWQFVQFRGREYGLNQTPHTDDRLDPEKATRAAARHLRDLYTRYGDWYLAVAAYNCGPGAVDRAVQRTGYADVWELRSRGVLPKETSNYIPIILAMTIMAKNARDYGLEGVAPDAPVEYDTINVSHPTHLSLIADLAGKPLAAIQALNPAVLKHLAPAGYAVHVPRGTAPALMAGLENIPANGRASWRAHRLEDGESPGLIAKRYGISLTALTAANQTKADAIEPGDLLLIPASIAPAAKSSPKPDTKPAVRATSRKSPARKAASKPVQVARR